MDETQPKVAEIPHDDSPTKSKFTAAEVAADTDPAEEQFEDCEEFLDEESQRDYEATLSDDDLQQNKEKAECHKVEGNDLFKGGQYEESVACYTEGLKLCPIRCGNERAILYANRAAAKTKLNLQKSAVDDCSKAIEFNPNYVKALLR
jgi:tetratricopeptide (TPR) repeat protein